MYPYPIQTFSFPPSVDVEPTMKRVTADCATLTSAAERQTNYLHRLRQRLDGVVQNPEPLAMVKARADRGECRIHAARQAMARGPAALQTAEAILTQNGIALDVLEQIVVGGLTGRRGEHACLAERWIGEARVLVGASPDRAAALSELAAAFDASQPRAIEEASVTLKNGISRLQAPGAAAGHVESTRTGLSNGLTRPLTAEPDPFGETRASSAVRWQEMKLKIRNVRAMYGELDERPPGLCEDVKKIEDAFSQMVVSAQQGRHVARRRIEVVHSGCDHLLKHLTRLVTLQRQGPASISADAWSRPQPSRP